MTTVHVSGVSDFTALGERWSNLEQRATGSFFQSWSWTGCLAAERFPDPVLVEATENGRTVALALFNRVRRRVGPDWLYLGETGHPDLDCPYIEDNGVLTEAGRETVLSQLCLRAVAASHVLILSGIDQSTLQAAQRVAAMVCVTKTSESPFVDLKGLRVLGTDYLQARRANTRQQIRRSDRFYVAGGRLTVRRAGSSSDAHAMLDAMAVLHQASWTARGQPGSFANPFFARFHRALIEVALPRGQIALTAVSSADTIIGILYNFSFQKRLAAYQSGFNYPGAERLGKPGLTSHHAAIRDALDQGFDSYEFLAGGSRYKHSLADRSAPRYWAAAGPVWSPRLLISRLRGYLGR